MTSLVLSKEHTHPTKHTQRTNSRPAYSVARDGLVPPSSLEDFSSGEGGDKRARTESATYPSLARAHLGTGRQHIRTELLAGEILPLAA